MDETTQTELLGVAVILGRMGFALRQTEARLAEVTSENEALKAQLKEEEKA